MLTSEGTWSEPISLSPEAGRISTFDAAGDGLGRAIVAFQQHDVAEVNSYIRAKWFH